MDECKRPNGKCRTLLALLLTMTLPGCLTIGLWELEDGPPARTRERVRAPATRLIVPTQPYDIRIHPDDTPDGLRNRGLTSLGLVGSKTSAITVAHALLHTPELLRDAHIDLAGRLPLFGVSAGTAELHIRGTVDHSQLHRLSEPTRELVTQAISTDNTVDHHSSWRWSLNDVPQSAPAQARQVPVDLAVDIEQRGSGSTSWSLRTAQVVLTPPAVALDLIVTPIAVIYYGIFWEKRFIF